MCHLRCLSIQKKKFCLKINTHVQLKNSLVGSVNLYLSMRKLSLLSLMGKYTFAPKFHQLVKTTMMKMATSMLNRKTTSCIGLKSIES